MRALAVIPGQARSACLLDVPEPGPDMGSLLVQTLAMGICGTDVEIASGRYGWPPPGRKRLIIGHESIGRVLDAPEGSNFASGDLIVGVVRRPDPMPCRYCAVGEWDIAWLSALITRRVPLADWQEALERRPHDIKVIIEFGAHA